MLGARLFIKKDTPVALQYTRNVVSIAIDTQNPHMSEDEVATLL